MVAGVMRFTVASLFVVLTLGCASSPSRTASTAETAATPATRATTTTARYSVVDLGPAFLRFYDETRQLSLDEQLARFRAEIVDKHPSLFVASTLTPGAADFDLDTRLRAWLPTLPSRIDTVRRLSGQVRDDLGRHDATFRNAFPDLAFDGVVYFTVSIDAFDGGVRTVDGASALCFGLDTIARVHGDTDLGPLFHHELFHLYHAQRVPALLTSVPSVGLGLWVEGLAVHVARSLNPQATWRQLTLTDEMVATGEAHLSSLASAFLPHLAATDSTTYRRLFLGVENTDPGFSPRVGYFFGMKVAALVQGERSLHDVTGLWGKDLDEALVSAVTTLVQ